MLNHKIRPCSFSPQELVLGSKKADTVLWLPICGCSEPVQRCSQRQEIKKLKPRPRGRGSARCCPPYACCVRQRTARAWLQQSKADFQPSLPKCRKLLLTPKEVQDISHHPLQEASLYLCVWSLPSPIHSSLCEAVLHAGQLRSFCLQSGWFLVKAREREPYTQAAKGWMNQKNQKQHPQPDVDGNCRTASA